MIVNLDLGRSLLDDSAADQRSSARRERIDRERKADAQRMEQAAREQRTSEASSQRLHDARLKLLAFEAEEHAEAREVSESAVDRAEAELAKEVRERLLARRPAVRAKPKEQMLPAVALQAKAGASMYAVRHGAQPRPPTESATEREALDACHEFDRGWAEADGQADADLAFTVAKTTEDRLERAAHATAARTAPHGEQHAPATPAAARARPQEQLGTKESQQEAHHEAGQELPQDIAAALDTLHALAQRRSDCGIAGQADQARMLDHRIEGTLAFLEGYVLDEAEQAADPVMRAQLATQLSKAREGLEALRQAPQEGKAKNPDGTEGTAVNNGTVPSITTAQQAAQQLPQPVVRKDPALAAVEAAAKGAPAARAAAGMPVQTDVAPAVMDRGPVRASELERLRDALDDDDARQDMQQASLNSRRDSVTLPQRVVQSV